MERRGEFVVAGRYDQPFAGVALLPVRVAFLGERLERAEVNDFLTAVQGVVDHQFGGYGLAGAGVGADDDVVPVGAQGENRALDRVEVLERVRVGVAIGRDEACVVAAGGRPGQQAEAAQGCAEFDGHLRFGKCVPVRCELDHGPGQGSRGFLDEWADP